MMNKVPSIYLYLTNNGTQSALIELDQLESYTERHKISIELPKEFSTESNLIQTAKANKVNGLIIQLDYGIPSRSILSLSKEILSNTFKLYYYWPKECALEVIDRNRFKSYKNIRKLSTSFGILDRTQGILNYVRDVSVQKLISFICKNHKLKELYLRRLDKLRLFSKPAEIIENAHPAQFSYDSPIDLNRGMYLRLDFWATLKAGGSYGHTCYIAKELAARCQEFQVLTARHYKLLDDLGIKQITLGGPEINNEFNMVFSNPLYSMTTTAFAYEFKPDFIYERLVLGNYVGAELSQQLNIPYIVEYNGSEIAMRKSFDNSKYEYDYFYLEVEQAALKQATAINVISQTVAEELIERNVPAEKILVNPNGANEEIYCPIDIEEKTRLKRSLGWTEENIIVGFVGTFGGWHGIDILADALPKLCKNNKNARFLLIGDGHYKKLIENQIAQHQLESQIKLTGMVAQEDAVSLLQACDIYVSPHSSHMSDSRFFGSPTKLFEYMALGGGIVASDLVQIGEVLKPSVHIEDIIEGKQIQVNYERAILCKPGDVEQFIAATDYLIKHPDLISKLGHNARQAVIAHYSWSKHIDRLFAFINKAPVEEYLLTEVLSQDYINNYILPKLDNGSITREAYEYLNKGNDSYKDEVQNQWNNDPCGSHYVKKSRRNTLEWYEEAENYRYNIYAPWMHDMMEFDKYEGKKVLEVGAGMGTDLLQFAKYGANTTDLDLSAGHLAHAQENFKLRNLEGEFKHGDAENMPFEDDSFDVVYSNGVIHHSPNTQKIVDEMYRVLKPGGKAIIMVYAENSLHYWHKLVWHQWLRKRKINEYSIGEIMSQTVEISDNGAKPLVKVYTKKRLKALFKQFNIESVKQQQMIREELPRGFRTILSPNFVGKFMGWNLIIKATKPE